MLTHPTKFRIFHNTFHSQTSKEIYTKDVLIGFKARNVVPSQIYIYLKITLNFFFLVNIVRVWSTQLQNTERETIFFIHIQIWLPISCFHIFSSTNSQFPIHSSPNQIKTLFLIFKHKIITFLSRSKFLTRSDFWFCSSRFRDNGGPGFSSSLAIRRRL